MSPPNSNMTSLSFKQQYPFQQRIDESRRIMAKYPDRIPVIIEKHWGAKGPDIDKKKYLVPHDLTGGQFMYVIRKRLKLKAEEALFMFAGENTLVPSAMLLKDVYASFKDTDNFLYFRYSFENTFGVGER